MAAERPDGGWGWVIVTAGFLFGFIVDGVKYSFGIMFMELLDAFERSKSDTSWIISIQIAMVYACSPISGALVNRYGCRVVAVLGTIIGFIGFVVSPFASSVFYLYATYGVVGGIGFGMISLPIGVSVARYFDKHLALAFGIRAMGSGVGMLLFGPLSKILIDEYTWRGTLLIEAALLLNGLLCAAVLRPIPERPNLERLVMVENENITIHHKPRHQDYPILESPSESNVNIVLKHVDSFEMSDMHNDNLHSSTDPVEETKAEPLTIINIVGYASSFKNTDSEESETESIIAVQKDALLKIVDDPCNRSNDTFQDFKNEKVVSDKEEKKRWFSFSSLREPKFLLLLGSLMLVDISIMVPFTFLPDMMSEAGYMRKDSVFMLFLIGLLSTTARLVTGIVADLKVVNRVTLCYSIIMLNGVLTVLCPFCFNYQSYVAFAVVFGFASGSSASLRAVLLPELFGTEMIADRMGILHFFCGFAALVGLPITGAIYDASGSYVIPFSVAGIEHIISGLLVFLITLLWKK